MPEAAERCVTCAKEFPPAALEACFLCARRACPNCTVKRGGHVFCSQRCADVDFFSGLDDESDQFGEE